jgi:indole-3-glycerol phosphate synthase
MSDAKGTYLERILAVKRAELAAHRKGRPGATSDRALADELAALAPTRDLQAALRLGPAPRVIAEFKRASPSAGVIREDADPRDIVAQYAEAGAAAISVLTDQHFEGSMKDLRAARGAVSLPVLCKDFILERSQIAQARRAGADAVLLIAAALEPPHLRGLVEFAHMVGMQVLCEAHDEHEVDRALAAGARLIGVNSRDLHTFEVDLQRCVDLRKLVPKSFVYVAESGIRTHEDVAQLREAGVDAILVGTHLMAAEHPGDALRELRRGRS